MRDTASHVGPLPQIFSDNAAMAGGGLFFQPYRAHYFLSGEANEAYLFKQNSTGRTSLVPDYRAIAGYFRSWSNQGGPFKFEANGSVGFYSRYNHDGIAYLQPREVLDLFRVGDLRFSSFLQGNVALDTNHAFYNNTGEVVPGLDIHAKALPGASLRFQYVWGYYLDLPTNSPNPYGPTYRDLRFRLLYGRNVSLGTP
jgi:hypothetical protein